MEDNKPAAYEIRDETGRKVDLVHPDSLELALEQWNALRELDIDGNPIGLYTAEPAKPGAGWGA